MKNFPVSCYDDVRYVLLQQDPLARTDESRAHNVYICSCIAIVAGPMCVLIAIAAAERLGHALLRAGEASSCNSVRTISTTSDIASFCQQPCSSCKLRLRFAAPSESPPRILNDIFSLDIFTIEPQVMKLKLLCFTGSISCRIITRVDETVCLDLFTQLH